MRFDIDYRDDCGDGGGVLCVFKDVFDDTIAGNVMVNLSGFVNGLIVEHHISLTYA